MCVQVYMVDGGWLPYPCRCKDVHVPMGMLILFRTSSIFKSPRDRRLWGYGPHQNWAIAPPVTEPTAQEADQLVVSV